MSKKLKFKTFGICNYRSVSSTTAWIEEPADINVIIGQNNSGKSNILKFISRLPLAVKNSFDPKDPDFELPYGGDNKQVYIAFKINSENSPKFQVDGYESTQPIVYANRHGLKLSQTAEHLREFKELPEDYVRRLYRNMYFRNVTKVDDQIRSDLAASCLSEISKTYQRLSDQVILYIPASRGLETAESVNGIQTYSGDRAIKQIFDIMEPNASHDSDKLQMKFDRIKNIIKKLLTELDIEIVNAQGGNLLFNDTFARLPYKHFGYGIQQLLVMACAIELSDASVICIDEPEIAMHPTLQHRFMKYLQSPANEEKQFFLATHSSVFANYQDSVSVYHVTRKSDGTNLNPIITNVQASEMIDDLGIHASDLYQSNAVIWVEGPSDRVLLKKWISLIDPDLTEGIHFSIVFYGGANLFHHTGKISEGEVSNFIQMLRVNRHSLLFADRDRDSKDCQLKPTLKRVLNELGEDNVWITEGRELENYIPDSILQKYLAEKERSDVTIKLNLYENLSKTMEGHNISYTKMSLATFAAENFTDNDLNQHDLRGSVDRFVSKLRDWNKPLLIKTTDLGEEFSF